jgi:carnitine 3-dehydrogenase
MKIGGNMTIEEMHNVCCVGAGVIGYSWALGFALKKMNVTVYDITDDALNTAKTRIHESLKLLIKNNIISEEDALKLENSIKYTTSMQEAVENADFIQESGPEHYDIKQKMVTDMETYCKDDALIASSTSGLLITKIAENAKHPERFVGGHPYNPPHLIPLVEITKGEKTTETNVALAKAFYTKVGKEPVILNKEALGFICNRLQMALYREICELVMRGVCSIEDADKAVTYGPGLRWGIMGPSLVFQLGGGKVGVDGLMTHLHDSIDLWLNDMADWKEFPQEFPAIARAGVEEEIKNRPPEEGNTIETLEAYRDDKLIEMLKLHNKL